MARENPERVGAMPADNETDLVRCERSNCRAWESEQYVEAGLCRTCAAEPTICRGCGHVLRAAELDSEQRCADCGPGDLTTAQELQS